MDRATHRAYVDAGMMSLADYVAQYGDDQPELPFMGMTVCCPIVPEGFNEIMQHTVVGKVTGVLITNPKEIQMTDEHGFCFTFSLTSARAL